jgi:signal peptide peptidase SppA
MSLIDLALRQQWAITEDGLRTILDLINRESLDPDLARQIREDRAERPSAVAARGGTPLDGAKRVTVRGGVAVLEVLGPIVRRADLFSDISGATSVQALARDFDTALRDPMVKAILLAVDSPGGEVTGINEFADMIYAARTTKPVWAYVEGLGASAAYWLASAAEEVVCESTAVVGSIGVVMAVKDPAKAKSTEIEIVSSQSPNKRPDVTTSRGRSQLQAIVDDTAAVFVASVARNRDVAEERVLEEFGAGGVLVGKAAVTQGLADRLGSFEATVDEIAQVADARKRSVNRFYGAYEEKDTMDKGFWANMFGGMFKAAKDEGIDVGGTQAPITADPLVAMEAVTATLRPREDDTEIADLRRQLAEQRTQQTQARAAQFADGAVSDRRAFPAERDALLSAYVQAADDDATSPVAGESRVQRLEAMIAQRPQHTLTSEVIAQSEGQQVLSAKTDEVSEDRKKALLAMTPLGQAALARRAKSA